MKILKTYRLAGEKVISSHKLQLRNYLKLRQKGSNPKSVERVGKSFISTFLLYINKNERKKQARIVLHLV